MLLETQAVYLDLLMSSANTPHVTTSYQPFTLASGSHYTLRPYMKIYMYYSIFLALPNFYGIFSTGWRYSSLHGQSEWPCGGCETTFTVRSKAHTH